MIKSFSLSAVMLMVLSIAAISCHAETQSPHPAVSGRPANYRAAADYSSRRNGFAVLVQKNGRIVFEDYRTEIRHAPFLHEGAPDKAHRLASGTKSFWGVAAAAAVMDGFFTFDERVCDTITEWKNDPRKSRITVRQLLSLTSGIEAGMPKEPLPAYSEALVAKASHEPGVFFQYGSVPFQVFGELLKRKLKPTGESPVDYLMRRVLRPIGLNVAEWRLDKEGNPHMPSGAFLTAREWAKFGQLILDKGRWNGRTIIDGDILNECFQGSGTNPAYGLTFWLNKPGTSVRGGNWNPIPYKPVLSRTAPDLIIARGHGKQRLYIIPSKNMVIVRFGESENLFWKDGEFLKLILGLNL
jgi:CubicO group peptidase (beta-lactamase class C family)